MFNKIAIFSDKHSVKVLNQPQGKDWNIFNLPNQIKTASKNIDSEDLGGFDLKQATKEHPDHLYVKIFAIKKDEPNDNGDAFSEKELKKATETFIGVPLFTNHQNDDVEKARGECVHAWYDEQAGGIYIVGRVDKVAYPKLARGIEEGYIRGCSMGCFLGHNRVLMADGSYKCIYNIEKGEGVITHKGRRRKVKNVQIHEDKTNDIIYKIKVEGLPNEICVTGEHPFYVLEEHDTCYITGEKIPVPKKSWKYNKYKRRTKKGVYQKQECKVALKNGELEKYDFEWKKARDLKEGDMLSFPVSTEILPDPEATIDKARLIGYFLAEGSYIKYKGEKTAIEFNLCLSKEKDTLGKEIIGLLRRVFDTPLEPKIQERPDRDILMIRLYGKDIARWFFDYCGEYSHQKKMNEKCLFWDPKIQKHILATWINGDGTCRNIYHSNGKLYQNISGTTCSETLHNQMKFISYRLGIYAITEQRKEWAIKRGKKPYWNLVFGCKESQKLNDVVEERRIVEGEYSNSWFRKAGDYIVMPIKKIEEEYNVDPVYNIEVEEDHSYIVEGVAVKNCSVQNSICSICHNVSATADHYCVHISNGKNRKYSGEIKCKYFDSKDKPEEDKCPICGSTRDNIKTLKHSEQKIYEHNFGLKFIENSFVVNPACHDCGVTCVLHVPNLQKKIASLANVVGQLVKEADAPFTKDSRTYKALEKVGGVKELNSLKNSMNEMEQVVKSMLQQKENISMEYVSDLVKAMADVQNIVDELVEMGYAALPSPVVAEGEVDTSSIGETQSVQPFPRPVPVPSQSGGGESSALVEDLGGLGNITLPSKSSNKKEDFSKISENINNKAFSQQGEHLLIENYNKQENKEIGANMATDNNTKTAASADNLEVITEKQLEKKEETLHPRTNEVYEGITESKEQIGGEEKINNTTSESPQVRKGTYETITEDQLKSESVLGEAVIHFSEYPDVITEKQWTDFSRDVAGDLATDYTEQITQAQIRDLLSKHKFIGNLETITEDQIKNMNMTDGLQRWANSNYSVSLVKTAIDTLADAIAKYRKSPEEIKKASSIINDDVSIKTKAARLAVINSLPYKREGRESIANNIYYFSKKASQNKISAIDALILSSAEHGKFSMKADDLFDSIHHILQDKKSLAKVEEAVEKKMGGEESKGIISKAEAIEKAFKVIDRPEDGKYRIKATLEDIGVPITDKVAFLNGVKKFAQEMIDDDGVDASAIIKIEVGDNGELIIDIEEGASDTVSSDDIGDIIEGPVEDIDADINGENEVEETEEVIEENPIEEEKDMTGGEAPAVPMAAKDNKETKISSAKKEIKQAQLAGGEIGGQGGAATAPGAGASLPATPPMGTPPMENFTEDPLADEEGDLEEDNIEARPPGSICPVCGSDDVDIISGKGKCNNCGSEMTYKVEINVTKWQGVTPTGEEAEEEVGIGEGEGFELPQEGEFGEAPEATPGEMPTMAAYTKLLPNALKKIASQNIQLGTISPVTGTNNTLNFGDGNYICLDTGVRYKISCIVSENGKKVYAQWEWKPKVAGNDCPSCSRAKERFVKALSTINLTEDEFDKMELKDKIATIVTMNKSGSLKKMASKEKDSTIVEEYKVAYGNYGKKFPLESCVEKLARRFGKDAVCLSGPDEGKNLAESVCNRLKNADVYTSKLASKVASIWNDTDGDEDCITDQIRSGYSLREAASICNTLKSAMVDSDYIFTDSLTSMAQIVDEEIAPTADESVDNIEEDIDPFENIDEESVSITLPKDVVEKLDQELDVALGENPAEEEHHQDSMMEETAPEDMVQDTENGTETGEDSLGSPIEEVTPEDIGQSKPVMDGGETKEVTEFEEDMTEDSAPAPCVPGNKKVKVNVDPSLTEGNGEEETPLDYQEAVSMRGSIGKVGKPQMNLSSVIESINKIAGEKQISQQKAQDSKEIGTYTAGEDGSKIGHENETIPSAIKPSVPRDQALMGQEDNDLNPQDGPQPVIPSENATMGHEDEIGLSGGDNSYTGGDKGQGKTELASVDDALYHMRGFGSSKKGLKDLVDRIAVQLAPKEPVAKDKDIQPVSDGGVIGKEEKFTADEPENVEGNATKSLMGHENETLEKAPKEPVDQPDVFTGDAQMGKEELDSEKTNKDKGTVIAQSDSEFEAYRVAGRMLQAKKISVAELQTKINELKQYKPAQIKDIEKYIFAGQKGLDTVSDGISQAVQINENSSVRNGNEDLSFKLRSLFTLDKQNKIASSEELTEIRKAYGKL